LLRTQGSQILLSLDLFRPPMVSVKLPKSEVSGFSSL
jgi:hypothetical protein